MEEDDRGGREPNWMERDKREKRRKEEKPPGGRKEGAEKRRVSENKRN
jgi:hypothetical protein